MGGISTFDGNDSSQVIPDGVQEPFVVAPHGALLVDLNLGFGNLMLETGVNYIQTGSGTGSALYSGYSNFSYNDRVTLTYVGLPISAKYLFSGERNSSFYVKAGINPTYLVSHSYETFSGNNQEYRFRGYTQWDFMFTAGIGYTQKLGRHFQLVGEVSGFQGIIPVFNMYNAYNAGGAAGIGISYIL